jgi:tetratricopeptide (TPR) repeat protein
MELWSLSNMRITEAQNKESWLQDALAGRNLKSIFKLYIYGLLYTAPIVLLVAIFFGASTAYKVTPVIAAIWVFGTYISIFRTVHSPASVPIPQLELLIEPPEVEEEVSCRRARDLTNEGAEIAASAGRWSEALDLFERAIRIAPGHAEAWSNKGIALCQLGQQAGALGCLDRALAIAPTSAELLFNKALLVLHTGQTEQAVKLFKQAREVRPLLLREALLEGLTHENALRYYHDALNAEDRKGTQWYLKGQVLLEIGRYREALRCFQTAGEMGAVGARQAISKCLEFLRKPSSAQVVDSPFVEDFLLR